MPPRPKRAVLPECGLPTIPMPLFKTRKPRPQRQRTTGEHQAFPARPGPISCNTTHTYCTSRISSPCTRHALQLARARRMKAAKAAEALACAPHQRSQLHLIPTAELTWHMGRLRGIALGHACVVGLRCRGMDRDGGAAMGQLVGVGVAALACMMEPHVPQMLNTSRTHVTTARACVPAETNGM
jgi:hypothetical protein